MRGLSLLRSGLVRLWRIIPSRLVLRPKQRSSQKKGHKIRWGRIFEMGQIEARSKKIAFRKPIPSHTLLFDTRLPGLKAPKKLGTAMYCVAFFLGSQGHFLYTLSLEKQGLISPFYNL